MIDSIEQPNKKRVIIDRDNILRSTFHQVKKIVHWNCFLNTKPQLQRWHTGDDIEISFLNEAGIDANGLSREFYVCFAFFQMIFCSNHTTTTGRLFWETVWLMLTMVDCSPIPTTLWVLFDRAQTGWPMGRWKKPTISLWVDWLHARWSNPFQSVKQERILFLTNWLLSLSFFLSQLGLCFAPHVVLHLIALPNYAIDSSHMQCIEPDMWKQYERLKSLSEHEIQSMEQSFSVTIDAPDGSKVDVALCDNGSQRFLQSKGWQHREKRRALKRCVH